MTVSELIKALSALDQTAEVVVSTKCKYEDDDFEASFEHKVVGIEVGFSDCATMQWDLTFGLRPLQGCPSIPSIRLVGFMDRAADR